MFKINKEEFWKHYFSKTVKKTFLGKHRPLDDRGTIRNVWKNSAKIKVPTHDHLYQL